MANEQRGTSWVRDGARRAVPVAATLLALVGTGVLGFQLLRPAASPAAVTRPVGLVPMEPWIDSLRASAVIVDDAARVPLRTAVALGYIERARVGLSGPFRLADFAASDPRLPAELRLSTARALLEMAGRGTGYVIDPAVLATVLPSRVGTGARHLALIEQELVGQDPRSGELAVRLAYQMAVGERLVPRDAMPVIAQVTALLRDRELARLDAAGLLASARAEGRDPVAVIAEWRAARRFASERPSTEVQDPAIERRALPRAARLLDTLRALAATPGPDTTAMGAASPGAPLLPAAAAERLVRAARYLPPQGPVVVALRTHRELLADGLPASAAVRGWVDALPDRVMHDEALAAERARAHWTGARGGAVARMTVAAAVGMRAYAQEAPWFPGMPGPSVEELRRAHGFAEVRFTKAVPAAWRPYYRRMLASAATDLARVLPGSRFEGLKVLVEARPASAPLAVHDPASRTLRLPAATAAGVLAHELAHDLDWQAARRLYARRTGYSTDYAVRTRGDRIAASVQGLTTARLIPPTEANGFRPPHDRRPAEVFARNFDWFVAVSLAREGRVNGYLSGVQDEVLTGYATVSAREAGGRGAESLIRLLADVAFVAAPVRDWFLAQWGPTRTLRSYALVRELAVASPGRGRIDSVAAQITELGAGNAGFSEALAFTLLDGDDAGCVAGTAASSERSQMALARLAADARARGLVRTIAQRVPPDARPAWAQSALGVAPWSPEVAERATRTVRDALLQRLARQGMLGSPFATPMGCE